jgi:hypothetical protein
LGSCAGLFRPVHQHDDWPTGFGPLTMKPVYWPACKITSFGEIVQPSCSTGWLVSSTGRPISQQEVDGEVDSDVADFDSEAVGESVIVFDITDEVAI